MNNIRRTATHSNQFLFTIFIEHSCFPHPIAANAIEVNLCNMIFCITVEKKTMSDCRSLASSVAGCHLRKKIRLQDKVPDAVEIRIEFGLFFSSTLYVDLTSLPAASIIDCFYNFDDELPTIITSTYE
ncbi:unnamed protein product [Rotaria socialis]|uniref:Uncharacterized protein n=1 Tax=Rotaria socialis TaxID=392032 RepID=A0A818Q9W2_9BILA|nr:unnamed protein product [Rotaria socialis]CAF3631548.1 unnamed protein product [Rotaria socialis]CAF3756064.1 unnamed protein product [Rotaria socialis]CAF4204477.1 unnamed protein product [Rotaria socialis]CAF4351195.1 unnamed protein product [Rotaria socialis]